jgi:hypothetical protein
MLTAPEIYGIVTVEGNIFLPLKKRTGCSGRREEEKLVWARVNSN